METKTPPSFYVLNTESTNQTRKGNHTMKQTVNSYMFVDAFNKAGRESQFSRAARFALFDYLEDLEDGSGEEIELDVVAICCDFAEYDNAIEAASEYGETFEDEQSALEYLQDNTQVIEFDDGIIIQNF